VLYDALVDPAVLDLAGKAQRFYVGKRAGRHHVTQEQIHRILIRAARRGQRVVRLKGGIPSSSAAAERKRSPSPRPVSPSRSCPASAPP
jgi:uroporphyrin-III C-methyltransferase/precorrin-2 dehydrogenase/sirohydrochlorin ferrochelatase